MHTPEDDSEFVGKEPCPGCGSRDNLARYSDGHAYCFGMGCEYYEKGDGETIEQTTQDAKSQKKSDKLIPIGETSGWRSRKITEETAKKWGFTRSEFKGETVRVFNYRDPDTKQIIAQKIRPRSKRDMRFVGPGKRSKPLFGQHLWRDSGKKLVVVTGEMDAMSVSQAQGHKWPVVSVPNGDDGAKKALMAHIDWLERFEEVILMFDMDDSGQAAVQDCLSLPLTPGKLKVASLPEKDPNEMLMAGNSKGIIDAIWGAKEQRPDGLVSIDDIMSEVTKPVEWGIPWFLQTLTNLTYGRRWGEVYAIGAGTGIGKTDLMTQQMMFDIEQGHHVGAIYLEQKPVETAKRVAGKMAGKMFHVPNPKEGDPLWTKEELLDACEGLKGKVTFYDNFGQTDWEIVKGHIRFMAATQGIRIFYLDHLTAMADTANERESIEQIMKEMAGLAQELDIIIHFVSHLTTPEGKPHEEGGRVMIRHFKGSRSIGFWSFFMFGLERDQHAEDEEESKTTTFRVLKDRYTGQATGEVIYMGFDPATGRLFEKPDYDPNQKENDHGFDPIDDDADEIPF